MALAANPGSGHIPSPQALNTIDRYDGRSDPDAWISSLQEIADLYTWSDDTCLRIAKIRLQGTARSWAQPRQFADWTDFQRQLDHRFGETKETAIARLEQCQQKPRETPKAFADRFLHAAERAGRSEDDALVFSFVQRLQPELKVEVARQRLHSIEEIVTFCNYWQGLQGVSPTTHSPDEEKNWGSPYSAPRRNRDTGPFPPRRPEPKRFERNNNINRPPFGDVTNRPAAANAAAAASMAATASSAADAAAIEDLTRRFSKLELNMHQQLQDRDRQIKTLRFALQKQHQPNTAQINMMGAADWEHEDFGMPSDEQCNEDELDQDLLASIFVKRPADVEPQYKRMPSKRVAINPNAPSPYAPPRPVYTPAVEPTAPNHRDSPSSAAHRMPRQRQPFQGPPRGTPGTLTSAPPGGGAPSHNQGGNSSKPTAAHLANERARKMAQDLCRSIKLDGMHECTLPPQAVLTCLAGHLAGVPSLVRLGQDMAQQVDSLIHKMKGNGPLPAPNALNLATAMPSTLSLRQPAMRKPPSYQRPHRISTCKVTAHINGREVDCVIDTGASTSAVTLDCLRRLGLDDLIQPANANYLNADGRISSGHGKVPNLVLSLGDLETLITPTVTNALNYNMLIGNDVLTRAKAVIDYSRDQLVIQVDPTYYQEIPISVAVPHEPSFTLLEVDPLNPVMPPEATEGYLPASPAFYLDASHSPDSPPETTGPGTAYPPAGTLATSSDTSNSLEPSEEDMSESDDGFSSQWDYSNDPGSDDSELLAPSGLPALCAYLREAYADMDSSVIKLLATLDAAVLEGQVQGPAPQQATAAQPEEILILQTMWDSDSDLPTDCTQELVSHENPNATGSASDSPFDDADQMPNPYWVLQELLTAGEGSHSAPLVANRPPSGDDITFPEDDALADNREITFASMVDAANLTPEEYPIAVRFLSDNADVFCFEPHQLGTCNIGSHVINTGDAAPIKQAYYRMPYKKYEQLKEHVKQLLDLGIIRPSNSPWASPMHLVPKKDGSTRAVVDYRKLNAVTQKDAYPLPRIDDILYNIGPARWFSVCDLYSGYWQARMDDGTSGQGDSIARTAFCVPWGLFEFLRVPFGLTAAPATFMRIMNEVLQEHIGKHAFVYLDDIIVYSPTFDDHLEHLALVFESLRGANLKLNPVKCQFFKEHVCFLGYTISADYLSPDPRLVEAVQKRQEPSNAKEVASFLGLCNWYRRFVQSYSLIAEPLSRLTGANRQFTWGQEQQQAFDYLKDQLTSYPLLRRPDFSKPFFVYTDASTKAVGAVLAQEDEEGIQHPIAYHSRKLNPAQQNYPITHLECLAVVDAVCDHWSDFLLGHQFTVITDHAALKWLMTCPKLQGRLARWSLRLQEYLPFEIQYRKGSQNQAADALSRDPAHFRNEDSPSNDNQELHHHLLTLDVLQGDATAPIEDPPEAPSPTAAAEPSTHSRSSLVTPDIPSGRILRVSIEGNIGSGKSMVLDALAQYSDDPFWDKWRIVPEPVHEWCHLLGPFYAAFPDTPARHGLAALLQLTVLSAYARILPQPSEAPLVIMERSPWSSLAVFLPIQDLPPSLGKAVHQTAHHMREELENCLPAAIIYLRTDPNTCLQRIHRRQRPGESSVSLTYLQQLHQQYEQEIELFPGPKIIIDADQDPKYVCAAVCLAIQQLVACGAPVESYFPLTVRGSPAEGSFTSAGDPNQLAPPPESLLIHEAAEGPTDLGQGSHTPPPDSSEGPPCRASQLPAASPSVAYHPHEFAPTSLDFLCDWETEVPVLFQDGPGTFAFSTKFCEEYERRYHTPVNLTDRIDARKTLAVFADMGPWLSNGPTANIHIAVVPRKALPAIRVIQVHSDGTEVVFVDTKQYATHKCAALAGLCPEDVPLPRDFFPWEEGLRNEAYTLDSWVRIVRMRPLLPCGISLFNPSPPTLVHSVITPLWDEYTIPDLPRLRLTSPLPHQAQGLPLWAPPDIEQEIHMLDKVHPVQNQQADNKPPRRRSAKRAMQQIQSWIANPGQDPTSTTVPSDLPCSICGSPDDWSKLLICSGCDCGFHTYCIGLKRVPSGDWKCALCDDVSDYPESPTCSTPASPCLESGPEPPEDPEVTPPPSPPPVQPDSTPEPEEPTSQGAVLDIWQDGATLQYLKTQQYDVELLPDDSSARKRVLKRITKRAANYYWDPNQNKLYRRPTANYMEPREVPPPHLRESLIDQTHLDLGHLGIRKLGSTLMTRYYWPGIYNQVQARLRSCDTCLRHKTLFKSQPELRPLPPSEIWERVGLDSMGPFPPSHTAGNQFIIVCVDYASKWVEARPCRTLTSAATCKFFMEDVVARHSTPRVVCSDRGKEFQDQFSALLSSMGITHSQSAAYHPQGNGQAEATVKAITYGLQKAVGNDPQSWEEKLPLVLLGLRTAKHSSTKYSPYYILNGRHPVLPSARRLAATLDSSEAASHLETGPMPPGSSSTPGTVTAAPAENPSVDPGTAQLLQQRSTAQPALKRKLQQNILKAQEKQKKDFRKRHHPSDPASHMPEGSLVLMWSPPTSKLHKHKATEGPYQLCEYLEGHSHAVLSDAAGKRWKVAVTRLAPYAP